MRLLWCALVVWFPCSGSGSNVFSQHWLRVVKQTMFEQEVEDVNAAHKVDNHLCRRLIVMPITDAFNPHSSSQMFGKVQYGDKCSLPASIGRLIFEGEGGSGKPYEVPWLFEIKPVHSRKPVHTLSSSGPGAGAANATEAADPTDATKRILAKAFISPLDFRSPENYIFLPRWLMRTLGLRVNDLVDVSFVRIRLAGLVVFQPLTLDWDGLIGSSAAAGAGGAGGDAKIILEHEVNKYSSLTAGSTIEIEHGGTVYPLYIKETRGENGVAMLGVRVQDSDVKVDIDRSVLDALIKRKEEEEEAEEAGGKGGEEGEGRGGGSGGLTAKKAQGAPAVPRPTPKVPVASIDEEEEEEDEEEVAGDGKGKEVAEADKWSASAAEQDEEEDGGDDVDDEEEEEGEEE